MILETRGFQYFVGDVVFLFRWVWGGLPFISIWCATWSAVTLLCWWSAVGSLLSRLMVAHPFLLLWVISMLSVSSIHAFRLSFCHQFLTCSDSLFGEWIICKQFSIYFILWLSFLRKAWHILFPATTRDVLSRNSVYCIQEYITICRYYSSIFCSVSSKNKLSIVQSAILKLNQGLGVVLQQL